MAPESAEDSKKILPASAASGDPKDASQSDVARQMAEAVRGKSVTPNMPSFLQSVFSEQVSSSTNPSFKFGLKELNQLLILAVAAVVLIFLVEFFNGFNLVNHGTELDIESGPRGKVNANLVPPVRQLSYYLSLIDARNIFQPFERKINEQGIVPAVSQKVNNPAQNLKLVGISWLSTPESAAVMVEDKESNITYFAHQGEKIKNWTVQTIYTDRAVLTNQDEEITIKYEIDQK